MLHSALPIFAVVSVLFLPQNAVIGHQNDILSITFIYIYFACIWKGHAQLHNTHQRGSVIHFQRMQQCDIPAFSYISVLTRGALTGGGGEGPGPPWDLKNTIFSGFLPLNYVICIFEAVF